MRQAPRDRERLDGCRRLVDRATGKIRLEGRDRARRDLVENVDVVGEEIRVRRVEAVVHDEVDAGVLRLTVAVVVRVHDGVDADVVLPRAGSVELVRAVADRVLTEGGHVLERDLGQRVVRREAEAIGERRLGLLEFDGEGGVVHNLQTRHGLCRRNLGGNFVVALDRIEERCLKLSVGGEGAVVPRVDERLRGDGGAVREGPTVLELDGEVLTVGALDGLGNLVLRTAVCGVRNETGEQRVEDAAAHVLTRVRGDQRVLRLARPGVDDATGRSARRIAGRTCRDQHCRHSERDRAGRYA